MKNPKKTVAARMKKAAAQKAAEHGKASRTPPAAQARPGTLAFVTAVAKHRNWNRATDPPRV